MSQASIPDSSSNICTTVYSYMFYFCRNFHYLNWAKKLIGYTFKHFLFNILAEEKSCLMLCSILALQIRLKIF